MTDDHRYWMQQVLGYGARDPCWMPRIYAAFIHKRRLARPLPNEAWLAGEMLVEAEWKEPLSKYTLLGIAALDERLAEVPTVAFINHYRVARIALEQMLSGHDGGEKSRRRATIQMQRWLTQVAQLAIEQSC